MSQSVNRSLVSQPGCLDQRPQDAHAWRPGASTARSDARRVQGFTLLELLAVIAIIGILAAIFVPNFIGLRKRPHDVAALQCGKSIVTAQITYESEHQGVAADSLDQLNTKEVTGACRGVEVARIEDLTGQALSGTNNISSSGAGDGLYGFKVWSIQGNSTFIYSRWTGQRLARM